MCQDLENITSKEVSGKQSCSHFTDMIRFSYRIMCVSQIRNELEQQMNCNLKEYKEFIDNEMLLILGQMDKATLIFDHLYLVSAWLCDLPTLFFFQKLICANHTRESGCLCWVGIWHMEAKIYLSMCNWFHYTAAEKMKATIPNEIMLSAFLDVLWSFQSSVC